MYRKQPNSWIHVLATLVDWAEKDEKWFIVDLESFILGMLFFSLFLVFSLLIFLYLYLCLNCSCQFWFMPSNVHVFL